jgi:GxxExxY protein
MNEILKKRADELSYEVIGAAMEVHRELGPGFVESVYESALCVELRLRKIYFSQQHPIHVSYKGQLVGDARLDLLIDSCLIAELKAVDQLHAVHITQVMSYLKATRLWLGLLINFNVSVLKNGIKRIVL